MLELLILILIIETDWLVSTDQIVEILFTCRGTPTQTYSSDTFSNFWLRHPHLQVIFKLCLILHLQNQLVAFRYQ